MGKAVTKEFIPLNVCVITFSDTRTLETDESGLYLENSLKEAKHNFIERKVIKDDIESIKSIVKELTSNNKNIDVIITTGGTGFTKRDNTKKALFPMLTKHIEGFGELFRYLSYFDIGSSTIQSNAFAGLINETIIFCLPGSPSACKLAFEKIIKEQLNSTFKPCNLATIVKKFT